MRVFVTGAGGFLGRAVVAAVLRRGHDVVALVRPASDLDPELERTSRVVRGDLREPNTWIGAIDGADVVIHLAATAAGDLGVQFAGTVLGTESLLGALVDKGLSRFVHVSSFSVYDYDSIERDSLLDERSPLEPAVGDRDAYTATKRFQESLVRSTAETLAVELVVIRPGAIYGPGKNWSYGAGAFAWRLPVVISPRARFRLTHVENCAEAIALAVDAPEAAGRTLNVVDDDLPTHCEFLTMSRRAGAPVGPAIPMPWVVLEFMGRLAATIDRRLLGSRARFPELLSARRQRARWLPLRYSNSEAKRLLGWSPRISVGEGVADMVRTDVR